MPEQGREQASSDGFPGYWCGNCRGPMGSAEPSSAATCARCGAPWWPLDERLHAALTEAGFDGTDANAAVNAVLSVIAPARTQP